MRSRMLLVDHDPTSSGGVFQMGSQWVRIIFSSFFYKFFVTVSFLRGSAKLVLDTSTVYAIQVYDSITGNVICHGVKKVINEGHKSFPSGHTSCKYLKNV